MFLKVFVEHRQQINECRKPNFNCSMVLASVRLFAFSPIYVSDQNTYNYLIDLETRYIFFNYKILPLGNNFTLL